ncbi:hypothetical protein N9Z41_01775 [bacterium]|nr:hypothetical protein [bacterium]
MKKVFSFKEVMTIAVTANRILGGYVRESTFYCLYETGGYDLDALSNKAIIRSSLLEKDSKVSEAEQEAIKKLDLTPTAEDISTTDEICEYIEGLAMKALGGKFEGYEAEVYKIFEEEEIVPYQFGLLASFPKSFERIAKQEKVEMDVIKTCANSQWIAEPGSKIESEITVVNYIYSRNYNAHIYTAKTPENNLVTFWSQKDTDELAPVGKTINIKAKVKRIGESRFYDGVKETQLNHVKKVA